MCIPCPICIGTIVATAAGAITVVKKLKIISKF